MENVIHRLTLDLAGPDMCPVIEVQRGDSARTLVISLTQGGRPYWIAEGLTAALYATKPDGNPFFNACTIEKNRIRYDFTPQTANVVGAFDCEIWLVAGDKRELTTPRFTIAVDERMRTDDVIPESEPEYTAITEMVAAGTAMIEELREALAGLEGVEDILTQARAAAEAASNSEAAARGHAKTAADAAADALGSAGRAYASEQTAITAAGDAQVQAETAQGYTLRAEAAAKRAEDAAANPGQGDGSGSGQNATIDDTLTQSGKAADAKAVGDALAGKVGGIGITTIMAITQAKYDELVMLGEVSPTTLYIITASAGGGDAEVTMVPYLVSDGTAYIDTGYKCTANDVLELTYRDIGKPDDGTYITAGTPYCGGKEFHIGYAGSGYVQATHAKVYLGYKLTDQGAKATIKRDPTMLHYNGELVGTATAGTVAETLSTLIFAKKISDTSVSKCAHKVYFYGLKIWRGDSLVHYYKPAQDESGVACVYDAVTKEYFYNADTEGTLTYGEEVEGS